MSTPRQGGVGKAVVGGTLDATISVTVSAAGVFLLSILISRGLHQDLYGRYVYFTYLAQTGALVASLGLPAAATRFISELDAAGNRCGARALAFRIVLIQLAAALLVWGVFVAEELIAGKLGVAPHTGSLVAAGVALSVSAVATSALQGFRLFRALAVLNSVIIPLQVGAVWWTLHAGGAIRELILVLAAFNLISAAAALLVVRGRRGPAGPPGLAGPSGLAGPLPWRRVLWFALSLGGAILCDAVVWQRSEVFFLKQFRTAAEIGFYNNAYGLSSQVLRVLPMGVLSVLMPFFAAFHGSRETDRIDRLFGASSRILALFSFPLAALLSATAAPLISLIYGAEYVPGASVVPYLAVSGAIGVVAGSAAGLLSGAERRSAILAIGFFTAILNLSLDVLLIPSGGILGAALANSIAQVTAAGVGFTYVFRVLRPSFPIAPVVKCAVAATAAYAATAALIGHASVWVALAAGSAVYLILIRVTGALLRDERVAAWHLLDMAPKPVARALAPALSVLTPRPAGAEENGARA